MLKITPSSTPTSCLTNKYEVIDCVQTVAHPGWVTSKQNYNNPLCVCVCVQQGYHSNPSLIHCTGFLLFRPLWNFYSRPRHKQSLNTIEVSYLMTSPPWWLVIGGNTQPEQRAQSPRLVLFFFLLWDHAVRNLFQLPAAVPSVTFIIQNLFSFAAVTFLYLKNLLLISS